MSDHTEAERGRLAKAVLENPIYAESYALLESEMTRAWRGSRNPDEREEIHQKLLMLDTVKGIVESVMRTGQLAEDAIKRKQTQAERMALYSIRTR